MQKDKRSAGWASAFLQRLGGLVGACNILHLWFLVEYLVVNQQVCICIWICLNVFVHLCRACVSAWVFGEGCSGPCEPKLVGGSSRNPPGARHGTGD